MWELSHAIFVHILVVGTYRNRQLHDRGMRHRRRHYLSEAHHARKQYERSRRVIRHHSERCMSMLASYHDVKEVYSVVLMSGCSRHFLSLCHEQHARLMMVADDRQLRLRETHLVFPISLGVVTLFSRRPRAVCYRRGAERRQPRDNSRELHTFRRSICSGHKPTAIGSL